MEHDFYTNWFGHRSPRAVQPCRGPMPHLVSFAMKDDVFVNNYINEQLEFDDATSWSDLLQEAYRNYPSDSVEEYVTHQINYANEVNRLISHEQRERRRVARPVKVDGRSQKVSPFHMITFTYDPEVDTEESVKPKMDRFERSKFKNYKYMMVEEKHSADNKRYHRHYIVECTNKEAHTKNGLKRNLGHYYSGNINSKPITLTKKSLNKVYEYVFKENKPVGDVDYFRQKFDEIISNLKV